MTNEFLFQKIKEKKSFLCVGLDVDLEKIPKHLLEEKTQFFHFQRRLLTQHILMLLRINLI